ncbi:hypothetical protein KCU88_g541, partial [Aureobasidium melanogenum]
MVLYEASKSPRVAMQDYDDMLNAVVQSNLTLDSSAYELNVIQQPRDGHVPSSPHKRNARSAVKWPLDPPLVVEFKVNNNDTSKAYLTSPYWFCLVTIEAVNGEPVTPDTLSGTLTSSLHRVKMQDSRDHGVFVYGDLHIKFAGVFKLKITLFEMRQRGESMFSAKLASSISEPFETEDPKRAIKTQVAGTRLPLSNEPSMPHEPPDADESATSTSPELVYYHAVNFILGASSYHHALTFILDAGSYHHAIKFILDASSYYHANNFILDASSFRGTRSPHEFQFLVISRPN